MVSGYRRFKVNKLIRDKLPEIMCSKGIIIYERKVENDEYVKSLKDKLLEEAREVDSAITKEEICEELADILEVIISLSKVYCFSFDDIEAVRVQKQSDKGGFELKTYCESVEIGTDNSSLHYYLSKPDQSPEVK